MAKPAAVRKAAEEADRVIQGLQAVQESEAEPANGETPAADEPTPAPSAEAGAPPSQPPTSNSEIEAMREELEKANQRWRTLDGMIRAQNAELQTYKERVKELESAPAAEPETPAQSWSEDDEDAFGTDLVRYIHSATSSAVDRAVAPLRDQLAALLPQVEHTTKQTAQTAQERFEAKLGELVENWRVLDADQGFIDWLQSRPAIHTTLANAVRMHDAVAAAEIFQMYSGLSQPAPDPKALKRQQELEAQAAPPKNRQPGPSSSMDADEAPQWTLSEIQRVYKQKVGRDGRKLTPDEFAGIEREIAAAQAQGRVDYGR